MGKAPYCDGNGLKKGPWTEEEDRKLTGYIHKHGHGKWRILPKLAGLNRCGKSCRLRWTNYLRPDIKRGKFSLEDEDTIIHLHRVWGNKWSAIAACLPGRTDNEVKNFWNTHVKKKLLRMGIDPVTHTPRFDLLELASTLMMNSSLYHTSQQLIGINKMHDNTLQYGDHHYNPPGFGSIALQDPQEMAAPDRVLDGYHVEQLCPNASSTSLWQNSHEELFVSNLGYGNGNECSRISSSTPVSQNQTALVPGNSSMLNNSWLPHSIYANGGTEGDRDGYCNNSSGFGSYQ